MTAPATPRCPQCGHLPMMVLGGGTQAFCGNEDCSTLTWNPSHSLDENLLNTNFIRLPPPFGNEL